MATSRGNQMVQEIRQRVDELKQICAGIDEATASRAPAGRWSPKEILSHLAGPEGAGHLPVFRAYLDSDTPTVDLDAENPFFTETRARMSVTELLGECEANYDRICTFVTGLTYEQLERKAHVPQLKDSPLGEYPTLAGMIAGLGQYHLQFHIDHLREVLQALSEGA